MTLTCSTVSCVIFYIVKYKHEWYYVIIFILIYEIISEPFFFCREELFSNIHQHMPDFILKTVLYHNVMFKIRFNVF